MQFPFRRFMLVMVVWVSGSFLFYTAMKPGFLFLGSSSSTSTSTSTSSSISSSISSTSTPPSSVRGVNLSSASSSLASGGKCSSEGTMGLTESQEVSLNEQVIENFDVQRLHEVKHLTVPKYEQYLTEEAGVEHYALLHYLANAYGDCRHVVDIGTRYVASSLALGSSRKRPVPVWTFDIPRSLERRAAFRGKSEAEYQQQLKAQGIDITFHNLNLTKIPIDKFRKLMSTWLISLDTHHLPRTKPFEREFFARLKEIKYTGLLLLDDIHLNEEMREWWQELLEEAKGGLFSIYDVTELGHLTGTGLLDFSPSHADRTIVTSLL